MALSFIKREARIQGNEHLILPPAKEIGFNTELKHNDGLLAEMYMRAHHVDYPPACIMLEKDVRSLKTHLNQKRSVSLGKIGRLFLNELSVIQYECSAELVFPEYYGLAPFRCLELRYLEHPKSMPLAPKEKEDYIQIRIHRSFIRQIAACAAAILLFVLISTPVKTPTADYASILYANNANKGREVITETPAETTINASITDISADSTITASITDTSADTVASYVGETSANLLAANTATPVQKSEPILSQPQPKAAQPVQEVAPAKPSGRTYYIIVGSVETIKAAENQVVQQKAKGYDKAGYIQRDGRIRVYVNSFSEKKVGEEYVIDFRKDHPEHTDAWLFSAR